MATPSAPSVPDLVASSDGAQDEDLHPTTEAVSPAGAEAHAHRSGLAQLTDEQIREWSLEEKDRWWLENVYRGDMPQLTIRSGLTGMVLGGILALTNLYVGAKTGWTLGVGITSVILSFALFKVFSKIGVGSEMTLLENNAMQSIATSAGYMTAPLISSLAAYMMVTGKLLPSMTVLVWIIVIALLGVLFAFPLKKRFINDEQLPFPEGRAAGVVMEALHTGDAKSGLFKAKLLVVTALGSALVTVMKSGAIMKRFGVSVLQIPDFVDGWIYKLATPSIMGTPLKAMTVRPDTDIVMVAAGGLMGIRTGVSILLGACINYFILVPWMISRGDITSSHPSGVIYTLRDITFWSLWGGVAMMTTSSLIAFFSKPKVFISAIKGLFRRGEKKQEDVLKHIELPMSVFAIGIPVVGLAAVLLAHHYFGVEYWMGAIAIPLVFVFTLIAVNATGLTSITPTGALGKLTQLTFGAIAPGNVTTNLMTAGITGEVAGNASNLLMDIKPGYMLGGKPRHQAVGHVLGILAGSVAAVPVFFAVFMHNGPEHLVSDQYPFPGATIWKAVAEILTSGLSHLAPSARMAALVGALLGIALELGKIFTKGKFWLSAVGLGLAFVLPFHTSFAMFLGSFIFWVAGRRYGASSGAHGEGGAKPEAEEGSLMKRVFVHNQEPTCAGIIAGGALMGIAVTILEVFVLGGE